MRRYSYRDRRALVLMKISTIIATTTAASAMTRYQDATGLLAGDSPPLACAAMTYSAINIISLTH